MVMCAACAKECHASRRTPEGPICASCDYKRGGSDGECSECGAYGHLARGRCSRCRLALRIDGLRDAGDPTAVAVLAPYLDSLTRAQNADSTLRWLQTPTRYLLGDLLGGRIALTHEALDAAIKDTHAPKVIAFVRAALVHHGVLPERDEITAAFVRWTAHATDVLEDGPDRALVRAYATWHVTRQLAVSVRRGKTGSAAPKYARSLVAEGVKLTLWLHSKELKLSDLHQDLTDQWVSEGSSVRRRVRLFLAWLARTGTTGKLHVTWDYLSTHTIPLEDLERFALLRTLLHDRQIDPRDRLTGSLLLLYAQPVTRTARLTTADIHHDGELVELTLARGAVTLPDPLARIALEVRENAGDSEWLFPGRPAGSHLGAEQLLIRLKHYGITSRAGRHGALLALATSLPAPILAERLGFHPARAAKWARAAGATYADYVALRTGS
jgi:hypothetical protein